MCFGLVLVLVFKTKLHYVLFCFIYTYLDKHFSEVFYINSTDGATNFVYSKNWKKIVHSICLGKLHC